MNHLRIKLIWMVDADRYRNPSDDLPLDFDANLENYNHDLGKTTDTTAFASPLRDEISAALSALRRTCSETAR